LLRDTDLPWLSLSGCRVPALVGDGLRVDGALLLRDSFWATGGGTLGAVRLLGARIGGVMDLSNAQLIGQDWPPLIADGLQVEGDLILSSCRATGRSKFGVVRLPGARIGGRLDLAGAQLTNEDGATLIGDGLQVEGDLILRSCRATGRSKFGAVQLPGARIGGRVDLASAQLTGRDEAVHD
jgi:hypothetical protein